MSYVNNSRDSSQTQQNLNPTQGVNPILKVHNETLLIEEGPTIVLTNDVADMAIWDNPNTTWDGPDLNDQWDSYNTTNRVIEQVSNPRNIFIERFAFTTLEGTGTTATWDTTNKQVTFTPSQVLVVESAFKDDTGTGVVSQATLNVTVDSGSFDFELSANGGVNWESVTHGQLHTFTNTGSDLRIRITDNSTPPAYNFPFSSPTLSNNLVAYYKFDVGVSDTNGLNTGTVNGATLTTGSQGYAGEAYDYDGTNDTITLPLNVVPANNSAFSISLWINPDDVNDTYPLVSDIDSSDGFALSIEEFGSLRVLTRISSASSSDEFGPVGTISTGSWTHIVCTYDGSTLEIFVNGSSFATQTYSIGKQSTAQTTLGFTTGSNYYDGKIDEFGIWDRVLSSAEINQLYTGIGLPTGIIKLIRCSYAI